MGPTSVCCLVIIIMMLTKTAFPGTSGHLTQQINPSLGNDDEVISLEDLAQTFIKLSMNGRLDKTCDTAILDYKGDINNTINTTNFGQRSCRNTVNATLDTIKGPVIPLIPNAKMIDYNVNVSMRSSSGQDLEVSPSNMRPIIIPASSLKLVDDGFNMADFYDVEVGIGTRSDYLLSERDFKAPSYKSLSYKAPSYKASSYKAPSLKAPSYKAPSYKAPSYKAPSYKAPSYKAPSYNAPSYKAPSYKASSYKAPSHKSHGYKAQKYTSAEESYKAPTGHKAPSYQPAYYKGPTYGPYDFQLKGKASFDKKGHYGEDPVKESEKNGYKSNEKVTSHFGGFGGGGSASYHSGKGGYDDGGHHGGGGSYGDDHKAPSYSPPVYKAETPKYETPSQSYHSASPSYSAPEPSYASVHEPSYPPESSYGEPEETYVLPSYESHSSNHESLNYDPPSSSHGSSSYDSPSSSLESSSSYESPSSSHGSSSYESHSSSHESLSYDSPSSSHEFPSSYDSPSSSHESPSSYDLPSSSHESPSSYEKQSSSYTESLNSKDHSQSNKESDPSSIYSPEPSYSQNKDQSQNMEKNSAQHSATYESDTLSILPHVISYEQMDDPYNTYNVHKDRSFPEGETETSNHSKNISSDASSSQILNFQVSTKEDSVPASVIPSFKKLSGNYGDVISKSSRQASRRNIARLQSSRQRSLDTFQH